jgi:mannose-6-phosphate isomerase-like protein (cupin superfamily)
MNKIVNLDKCFDQFDDTFSPKIVGELNGQYVKLVRCEGDKIPWHTHDNEDEMFFVLEGVLEIHEKEKILILNKGEFYIVNKGVEHKVVPQGHVKMMLFEPAGIKHTGEVVSDVTVEKLDRLDL